MGINEEDSSSGNTIAIIFSLLCVIAIGWMVITNNIEEKYLSAGSRETCGVVYDYTGRDADANTMVLYEYKVNGRVYRAHTEDYEFIDCEETKACIGTKFLIVYSIDKPDIHRHYFSSKCP